VRIVTFYKHKTLIYISVFRPVVFCRGRRGRDRMIDGYTTAYAIGALSPLKLRVWVPLRWCVLDTTLYDLSVTCGRSMVFSRYNCFLQLTYHLDIKWDKNCSIILSYIYMYTCIWTLFGNVNKKSVEGRILILQ